MKIALYTSGATLNASTTTYVPTTGEGAYEVVGTGYTIGGNTLTGAAITLDGTTACLDFADTSWTTATFTARGALIYDFTRSNAAIAVLDFGSDKTASAGTFTVTFPAPNASTALIRIA
jgi:hypothetical protein